MLLKEFKECPNCKCGETVVRQAMKETKREIPPTGVHLKVDSIPLNNPAFALSADVVVTHYDVCLECGTLYCVKAELVKVPITVPAMKKGVA